MGDPRRDEDVVRAALEWYPGSAMDVQRRDADAALDRLTARLQTLERENEPCICGIVPSQRADFHSAHCLEVKVEWFRAARAVVLKGREHDKQQEHDLGGIASDASGTKQESRP